MSKLFESIQVENGSLQRVTYHEDRMNRSRRVLWGETRPLLLNGLTVPENARQGLWKCRIVYARSIEYSEFLPYQRRNIQNLYLVTADEAEYPHKYLDRNMFHGLNRNHREDDEPILVKNGLITDATFANLAFFDGEYWDTPAMPLLKGTRRQFLLDHEFIREKEINLLNFRRYSMVSLFNAMIDLKEICLPVSNISTYDIEKG